MKSVLQTQTTTVALMVACCVLHPFHQARAAEPASVRIRQTAPFIQLAADLGPTDPVRVIRLRVWLNVHQSGLLTKLAEEVTDETSPRYGKWLSHAEFSQTFAPSSDDARIVRAYLIGQGLTVLSEGPDHLWLRAEGPVAVVEHAFQLQLHDFEASGKKIFANTSDPIIQGDAGQLIAMIGGLTNRPANPKARLGPNSPQLSVASLRTPSCAGSSQTQKFTSADGQTTASYSGTRFGTDTTFSPISFSSCGYAPGMIQTAYGLQALYDRQLDGAGQTVVLVEPYGSPTIQSDLAAFNHAFNLPTTTLTIYQPDGNPVPGGVWTRDQQTAALTTSMDVEYAHTVAPGAALAVVAAESDSDDDPTSGLVYAIENHLGDVISNSWADPESTDSAAKISTIESVLKSAVVQGISVQFATGDSGDYVSQLGYADVSYPSSSPYATAVGGTTLALNEDGSVQFQAAWGNNMVQLTKLGLPLTPPAQSGIASAHSAFQCGSGGGTSRLFPKPRFQKKLPGSQRLLPDISYLADPFTGVQVLETIFDAQGNPVAGQQSVNIIGGTSLSTPMFSALWSIADQAAGTSLGLAAAKLYRLPKNAITDIQPPTSAQSADDVTGQITSPSGMVVESIYQLGAPEVSASFFSSLFYSPHNQNWYVLTFGTDSSLTVGTGWDSATGLGVPSGEAFVDANTQ